MLRNVSRHALKWAAVRLSGAALLLAFTACTTFSTEEWISLFNGRDLSGWTVQCQPQDREKVFWRLDQASILCDSMGRKNHNYVWLVSDQEFADFELHMKFQAYADSPGNSGLQFRSRFDDAVSGGWMHGPQVDATRPSPCPGAPD